MQLYEKLAWLRREKGLSQLAAAERLKVSRQAISRWEVGSAVPTTDNLKYLSELYEVPVDVLLDDRQDVRIWWENRQSAQAELEDSMAEHRPRRGAVPKKWVAAILALILAIIGVGITVGAASDVEVEEVTPWQDTKQDVLPDEREEEMFSFSSNW